MARMCPICRNGSRRLIDAKLGVDADLEELALMFDLDRHELAEHKKHTRAVRLYSPVSPEWLMAELQDMVYEIDLRLVAKEEMGSRDFSQLIGAKARVIDSLIKMTGATFKHSRLEQLPDWHLVRDAMERALKDFPKAREALEEQLRLIELESR